MAEAKRKRFVYKRLVHGDDRETEYDFFDSAKDAIKYDFDNGSAGPGSIYDLEDKVVWTLSRDMAIDSRFEHKILRDHFEDCENY